MSVPFMLRQAQHERIMPVELRNVQCCIRLDVRQIKKNAAKLLEAFDVSENILSILLTDDRNIARIHEQWMGDSAPTDVLSFPMLQVSGQAVLGDIVISVETAARCAKGNVMAEIQRYLIHGFLHLIGYDHIREKDHRRMQREATRLRRLCANA